MPFTLPMNRLWGGFCVDRIWWISIFALLCKQKQGGIQRGDVAPMQWTYVWLSCMAQPFPQHWTCILVVCVQAFYSIYVSPDARAPRQAWHNKQKRIDETHDHVFHEMASDRSSWAEK